MLRRIPLLHGGGDNVIPISRCFAFAAFFGCIFFAGLVKYAKLFFFLSGVAMNIAEKTFKKYVSR